MPSWRIENSLWESCNLTLGPRGKWSGTDDGGASDSNGIGFSRGGGSNSESGDNAAIWFDIKMKDLGGGFGDGLSHRAERYWGTNPEIHDSDGDGLPDIKEHNWTKDTNGDSLINVNDWDSDQINDGDEDSNLDGLILGDDNNNKIWDSTEVFQEMNPIDNDTDGDGYNDNIDIFPLDNSEWTDSDNDAFGDGSSDYDTNGDVLIVFEFQRITSDRADPCYIFWCDDTDPYIKLRLKNAAWGATSWVNYKRPFKYDANDYSENIEYILDIPENQRYAYIEVQAYDYDYLYVQHSDQLDIDGTGGGKTLDITYDISTKSVTSTDASYQGNEIYKSSGEGDGGDSWYWFDELDATIYFKISYDYELTQTQKRELVKDYSPVLYYHKDDKYWPISTEAFTSISMLMKNTGKLGFIGDTKITNKATIKDISETYTSSDYYLALNYRAFAKCDVNPNPCNNMGGFPLSKGAEIIQETWLNYLRNYYQNKDSIFANTVYANVYTTVKKTVILQYYFLSLYNDPFELGSIDPRNWELGNIHEGDWEMVQYRFNSQSDATTGSAPVKAAYSQHYGGEKKSWSSVGKYTSDNKHPVVWIALGSHASYFSKRTGLLSNNIDVTSKDYILVESNIYNSDYQDQRIYYVSLLTPKSTWLNFKGNWGSKATPLYEAPKGPVWRHSKTPATSPYKRAFDEISGYNTKTESFMWNDGYFWETLL